MARLCCLVLALCTLALAFGVQLCLPMLRRLLRIPEELVPQEDKAPDAVRVGIMGSHFIGRVAIVFAARKRTDVVVTAVASRSPTTSRKYAERSGIPVWLAGADAFDKMLERPDIDAVYVGLPTRLHFKWTKAALEAGKHVLVEKPAALNSKEVDILCQTAKRMDRVLMLGSHHRYHPAGQRTQALISSSEVGQLRSMDVTFNMLGLVEFYRQWNMEYTKNAEERLRERIKNLDRWYYCVDMLLWFSGAQRAEVLSAQENRYDIFVELLLYVYNDTQGISQKVMGSFSMCKDCLKDPWMWRISASGENGSVQMSNVGFPFVWHSIDVQTGLQGDLMESRTEKLYGDGETTFEHQLAAFINAVRHGKPNQSHLRNMLATSELIDDVWKIAGDGTLTSSTDAPIDS